MSQALETCPGTHPTKGISIEYEIQSKFAVLWLKTCPTDHNEIMHSSRQCYSCDICKISLWSAKYVMNKSDTVSLNFELDFYYLTVNTNARMRTLWHEQSGLCLNIKTVFPGMGISSIKVRWLWDCFIFMIGIPILLTHWGRDKMDVIFQTTFSNAFSWMKMNEFRLRFHWSLFPRVKLTILHHWFR